MSQRNSTYERKERDFYPTPRWVTEAVLDHIDDRGMIWEPACGSGAMLDVFRENELYCHGTDIESGADFFSYSEALFGCPTIITNPPYDIAPEFIRHALKLTRPLNGQVAMLLRVDFDSGSTRKDMFESCAAWGRKIVLTKRIVWFEPPPGARNKSPSENHAWYIWDWRNHYANPTVHYAPREKL